MKEKLDKVRLYKLDKRVTLFFVILILLALITGAIYMKVLSNSDSNMIESYINGFIDTINNGNFNYTSNALYLFISNLGLILLIWILGISIIGIPIIIVLFFTKCFAISFAISSFINYYKAKGILAAFIYVFPHQIINIFILIVLSAYALYCSIKILFSFLKKETVDFKIIMNKYCLVLLISIIGILITTLFESFITINIFKFVLTIIK